MSSGYEPIDNYEVVNFIAGGGSSQVFEVVEPATHRHLAMKLITNDHPDAKVNKQVLKAEAAVCKALDHPNIIHFESFTNGRDHTYMLMEYFRAPTLKVQLKMDSKGVHLRMKKLLEGVCGALQHVHDRGFVHRDIKPENVLMNKVGEVRLIDFSLGLRVKTGLAAMLGGKQSSIQGTRTYIAPETIRKQAPTFQTDLYSLGIMLFEVLTGRTPFQAPTPNELLQKHISAPPPNPSEFNKNVSPEMDRLVVKLLSKKPVNRGKDMAEISAELRRIRVFKEEIEEDKPVTDEKPADLLEQLSGDSVDSRLDAQRSELVRNNPELAVQLAEQKQERKRVSEAKKAKIAEMQKQSEAMRNKKAGIEPVPVAAPPVPPPPAMNPAYPYPYPMQPGFPPQMGQPMGGPPMGYPGMPQYGMPGQMPPGYPVPGPPMTMPPGMAPAPPAPGFPNLPPGVTMPPASIPGAAVPQGGPTGLPPISRGGPAVPPGAAPPAAPARPAGSVPPAAPVPVKPQKPEEELDFMTDLPDVL